MNDVRELLVEWSRITRRFLYRTLPKTAPKVSWASRLCLRLVGRLQKPARLAPYLAGAFNCATRLRRFTDQNAQVMILGRLGETVKRFPGFQVFRHRSEARGDGDFVVQETPGGERILIPHGDTGGIPLVIVALEITRVPGVMSFKSNSDRSPKILEINGIQVVDFASVAAHKQAVRTDP